MTDKQISNLYIVRRKLTIKLILSVIDCVSTMKDRMMNDHMVKDKVRNVTFDTMRIFV